MAGPVGRVWWHTRAAELLYPRSPLPAAPVEVGVELEKAEDRVARGSRVFRLDRLRIKDEFAADLRGDNLVFAACVLMSDAATATPCS